MDGSPLQSFKANHDERWKVLQDIPAWEHDNIFRWIDWVLLDSYGDVKNGIVSTIESRARIVILSDLAVLTSSRVHLQRSLQALISNDKTYEFVVFLECLIRYVRDWSDSPVLGQVFVGGSYESIQRVLGVLETSLRNGSKWTVVFDDNSESGLRERVDERLTSLAKGARSNYLTRAWNEAFGVEPQPEKAIENAQKALEQVASRKGLTKSSTKVFGTLLGDIKTNPGNYNSVAAEAYTLYASLGKSKPDTAGLNERFSLWFAEGMDLIQKTNPGHHPSKKTESFSLSPSAAKQAILVATVLHELIDSSYFFRVQKRTKTTEK